MKYYLDSFGCAKNQVDSENIMACLDSSGWFSVLDPADADLIIVNSCGFIKSAKQESINAVLEWRRLYPPKKILMAGCLAQRYSKELSKSLPEADGFFGIDDIAGIVEKVNAMLGNREWGMGNGGFDMRDSVESSIINDVTNKCCNSPLTTHSLPPIKNRQPSYSNPYSLVPSPHSPASRPLLSPPGSAYVKISEGCNNNCSYCAIPLIRGPLHCRPVKDIVDECKGLLSRGIKELCLIGQDLGSYSYCDKGLPQLLMAIAALDGDFWIRLLYMHPEKFPLPILDIMEKDKRFLPYFDIPFQHASARILAAMNRCTADNNSPSKKYLELTDVIRKKFPAAIIRTTFLLGFPGETDEDFNELLDFQDKLRADWLGCFSFSREDGTAAYKLKPQISKKTAMERQHEIERRQISITEKNMDRFIGQKLDVLLEEQIEPFWLGRLYCHAPEVDGAAVMRAPEDTFDMKDAELKAGDKVPCIIVARRGFDLEVEIVG